MKSGSALLTTMSLAALAVIPADLFYASRFVPRFKQIEQERIVTSNQLATAKIVTENLNHVRDLVFQNLTFSGQKDSLPAETVVFEFLSSCVNDLKMRLISVRPSIPVTNGRVTTYGYDIQLEGDFFSFGELCSKFENSHRVLALTSFEVSPISRETQNAQAAKGAKAAPARPTSDRRNLLIAFHLDTFRVKKGL